jgi:hypothetical protein
VPLGITLGKAAERHQTGCGRLERACDLRQALHQHLRKALCVGLGLETDDAI